MNKTDNMTIRQQKERAGGIDIHKDKTVVCFYIAGTTEEVKEYPRRREAEALKSALGLRDIIIW